MKRTNFKVQLIILEHVPEKIWKGINDENFFLVEDWETNALIPTNWY